MSLSKTIDLISGINESVQLFQWASSAISSLHSRWRGTQEQELQDEVQRLQSGLECLRDTLPAMYDLIDRAEWKSHKHCVAELLPKLKDAVYDADDLLDEFTWYELKVAVEGNASQSPFIDFFNDVIQGNFNKVKRIQKRLKNLSDQLEKMGLCEVTQRFDKSVRPETSSFPNEEIFGRDQELKQVMGLLGVPINMNNVHPRSKKANCAVNASTSTSASSHVSNGSDLPVLPIVGIGGVGKTTLAQHICSHPQVKSQFNLIIWIYVSDDFDVKRLTKEAIQSCQKKEVTTDNLDYLQRALSNSLSNEKVLIVLDDMWDDAMRENGQCWKKFCAHLTNVLHGSMILVTTRSQKVAMGVQNIMKPITWDGLNDDIFWNFFKLCVFGSDSSNNDPELERIGQSILPKLKGSPLAAKTLGRLLRMKLETTHWNNVLESELWQLKQEETDILPALRLSYMYLPFHLKRCFSFCAVYPKDHKFVKGNLAEIWVAEGFVEPHAYRKIRDIGCQYFEDLVVVDRSFFQKVCDTYVIHDLMHGMAQLVAEHDCFIIKNMSDFQKVPRNVRHLSILSSRQFDCSNLLSLCKYTKLRTLLCNRPLGNKNVGSMMSSWCRELRRVRVIFCSSTKDLPDSIGNLRHLRYLEISRACPFKKLPLALCQLYNLQILYARKCKLESLPSDFSKLTSLQRFESWGFKYYPGFDLNLDAANGQGLGIRLMKDMNHFRGDLTICNVGALSLDKAAQAELKNKEYLQNLKLNWFAWRCRTTEGSPLMPPEHSEMQGSAVRSPEYNETEVLQVLQPPAGVWSLNLQEYPGVSLPSWFQPQNFLRLAPPSFQSRDGLKNKSFLGISHGRNLIDISDSRNDTVGIFSSLTRLTIYGCQNITSLEDFLHPAAAPTIREIYIKKCARLVSVPTERFRDFHYLTRLEVNGCPNICSQSLVAPSLNRLMLDSSGNLGDIIECRSLELIYLSHGCLTYIQPHRWNLPALEQLAIRDCQSLTSIGNGQSGPLFGNISHFGGAISTTAFSSLTSLLIYNCQKLSSIGDLMTVEYLPAIESITIRKCVELLYLPGDRFGSFPCLKFFDLYDCPNLNLQRGLVLPSCLVRLSLHRCGDISAWFPSCVQELRSLVSLTLEECPCITSIPGDIWSSDLVSVQYLTIGRCPDQVSIGGANAVEKINTVRIYGCPKLKEAKQIMKIPRI